MRRDLRPLYNKVGVGERESGGWGGKRRERVGPNCVPRWTGCRLTWRMMIS